MTAHFKWKRSWYTASVNWPLLLFAFIILIVLSLPVVGWIRDLWR